MAIKEFIKSLLVPLLMRLPIGLLLAIKQDKILVRPMEYAKHRILMRIDTRDELSRAHSTKKEPGTVHWIEEYIKKNEVLYDVGANTGPYSLIAAANGARVVAIEPHPQSYAKLCQNIVLNNFGETVVPLPIALAEKTELSVFNYHTMVEGSSGHALGEAVDSHGQAFAPVGSHELIAYTLDELIAAFALPAPNHIKIDVDGIESKVLAGAAHTLQNPSVRTVLIELEKGDTQTRDAITLFAQKGFMLKEVREGRNHLFVRS